MVATIYNNTRNFYGNMWRQVLQDAFPPSMANFGNAYLLYDYASYRYRHDNNTRNNVTEGEMTLMARFASTEQRTKNANLSVSGTTEGDMIRAVAGRTMAAKTLTLLKENIRLSGTTNKINLAFTTLEAFVAWFALSGLVSGDFANEFKALPEQGAMMVFELFSIGGREETYPDQDDLCKWPVAARLPITRVLQDDALLSSSQRLTFPRIDAVNADMCLPRGSLSLPQRYRSGR